MWYDRSRVRHIAIVECIDGDNDGEIYSCSSQVLIGIIAS